MAKNREKQLAEYYFIEKNKTAREVALMVGITEATMSAWVNKEGWKARKEANAISKASRCTNIEDVISQMARERLGLSAELEQAMAANDLSAISDIRKKMASLDDGVAKWNKRLEGAKKTGIITLSTYLAMVDYLFDCLFQYDEKKYMSLIDFQEHHVREVSIKLPPICDK